MGSVSTEREAASEGVEDGMVGGNKEEIERSKVGIMRALLLRELQQQQQQQQDDDDDDDEDDDEHQQGEATNSSSTTRISNSSSQELDDLMIRRFLRARNLDIEKATNLLLRYLKWRKDFVPDGSICPSLISNQLSQNKLFMQGLDKMGRPIVVCFGGRHKHTTLEEFKHYCFLERFFRSLQGQQDVLIHRLLSGFVTYSLDKICARMPTGQEKFVCIGDLEGWGYSSSDVCGYLAALSILQDCYPERLGKLIIVHVPYIFMTAWKAVYPFIDSKTKTKITFVDSKKLRTTLLSDIEESQLPDIYGGKLQLVPINDC